jgi:hypothetical protein
MECVPFAGTLRTAELRLDCDGFGSLPTIHAGHAGEPRQRFLGKFRTATKLSWYPIMMVRHRDGIARNRFDAFSPAVLIIATGYRPSMVNPQRIRDDHE